MSIVAMLAEHADMTMQHLSSAGALVSDAALHGKQAILQASQHADHGLVVLAQAGGGNVTVDQFREQVEHVQQVEQLGWLANIGKYFIGIFEKGGEVFKGFVTGIIPTLVVLMTAFYALTELVGEKRVHGIARGAGRIALTRYTVLPVLAVFFLTNPMAYTFGSFLEEKHKPAFYDAAVSYVHPPLGLFPHVNPGEYFVWGGILVALQELERKGAIAGGYPIKVAIWYAIVGLVVILLKGMLTERITAIMARRQGVEL
jgi:glucitol/sorbitol PTS system EIIC component